MMTVNTTTGSLALALALAAGAAQPTRTVAAADTVTLRVDGRSSAAPSIAAAGTFVAVVWGASRDGQSAVFLAISRDDGVSFGAPMPVAGSEDARLGGELPPRVGLKPRPGRDPEIVVLWTARDVSTSIRLARSLDGGKTFGAALTLSSSGVPGDRGWPALAVDEGGKAHAIWLDHRGLAARPSGAAHDHRSADAHDGVAMAQLSGLYYAADATSASSERAVAGGVCYCCKTALAIAPDGGIVAAWRHVYPGNLRDIAFTVSRDHGRTFAAPVRVSEDGWAINGCPDDGPAMAVDRQGTVHIIWPTVISSATAPEGALFYTTSRDGRSFGPRVRIETLGSPKPSHPQIAVDSRGRVIVAWDELQSGRRVALLREVLSTPGQPPRMGPAVALGGDQPAAYPVLAATSRAIVAAWTSGNPGASVIQVTRRAAE